MRGTGAGGGEKTRPVEVSRDEDWRVYVLLLQPQALTEHDTRCIMPLYLLPVNTCMSVHPTFWNKQLQDLPFR